jgi:DNA-binding NarL/FixJ family response regulator
VGLGELAEHAPDIRQTLLGQPPGRASRTGVPAAGVAASQCSQRHQVSLASLPTEQNGRVVASLTERELQVLRGMSGGRSNGEIGRELYLSEDTIKTHARRLFGKLGARDRAHAVLLGLRHNLLT